MEPHEAIEQHEKNQEAAEAAEHGHAFAREAAVIIAVLAAVLAITTAVGTNAATDTILKQTQASDRYAEYQANSFKRHIFSNDAVVLRAFAASDPAHSAGLLKTARSWDKQVATKYLPNQNRLLPEAVALEAERDKAEQRHHTLEFAEALLQLAIVLSSVSIVVSVRALLFGGAAVGFIGLLLAIDGIFSIAKLPF